MDAEARISLQEGSAETDEIQRVLDEKVQELLLDAFTWDKLSHLFDLTGKTP